MTIFSDRSKPTQHTCSDGGSIPPPSILIAILICCLCLLAPANATPLNNSPAIDTLSTTDGALILENADSNENTYHSASGEFISYLRGNVVFRYEDLRISADEANWRRHAGIVDFRNNIRVDQRGQRMTCDRLHFERDRNVLTASTNVLYQDSARITFIRGDTAEYMTNKKEARLFGKPLLTRLDSASTDTIFLRGRIITYDDSLKIATVVDSVNISRGSLVATGQRGEYFANEDKAILRINPVIFYESHKVIGDSVDLFFNKEALESAHVVGNTHGYYIEAADSTTDTTITNIWSDSLHLSMFESGKINSMKAFGNARGNYLEKSDSLDRVTTTNISSDSLFMFMFETGKINSIKAFSDALGNYSEIAKSSGNTMTTNISSDSLFMFMSETGKVRAMKAYGGTNGRTHGRSAEWTASAKDTSITHIWSDSLRVSMTETGTLRAMRAFGDALSTNFILGDSARASVVSGKRMTLIFSANGKIENAIITGNAKSVYFLDDSEGGGRNDASGNRIVVTFEAGKAKRLRVLGNVKGVYSP